MASTSSDTLQSQSSTTPDASIDWASAFQCPEFLSGLQTALATINSAPRPDQLEQLGNSIPSQPTTSSASTQGNVSMAQGTFHAPSFVNTMSGSVQDTSSSFPQTQPSLSDSNLTTDNPILRAPNPSTGPVPNLCPESAFSLGPGRAPVPPKLVSKILSHKFVEMDELLPERLDDRVLDTTSFKIEGSTIVPVAKPSRVKNSPLDILDWVECFNSYTSIIATFHPHRARDLLAYMALIIRTAKRFGGKAWFHYDRAFRREAEVNNLQDWSVMRTDLYNFHTSAIHRVPDAQVVSTYRSNSSFNKIGSSSEATGNASSPQLCLSWNDGSCASPRANCRFRHACNITNCGAPHRRIDHYTIERRDNRAYPNNRKRQRSALRSRK